MEWNSPNFRNGTFHNELPTLLMSADNTMLKVFIKFMRKPKSVNPPGPLPSVRRVLAEAQKTGMPVATPMIGEAMVLHQPLPQSHWWEKVK